MATYNALQPRDESYSRPASPSTQSVITLCPEDAVLDLEAQTMGKCASLPHPITQDNLGDQSQQASDVGSIGHAVGRFCKRVLSQFWYRLRLDLGLIDYIPPPQYRLSRPPLRGEFRSPWEIGPNDFSDVSYCATYYKYHVSSLYFPPKHHYMDRGTGSPWIAEVTLSFHSLADFSKYNFSWLRNLDSCYHDSISIDWDAHPTVKGVTMFRRNLKLEFSETYRRHWKADVTIWGRDRSLVNCWRSGSETNELFTKDTCVRMEVMRVDDSIYTTPLCPRSRVFIKYPENSHQTPLDGERSKNDMTTAPDLGSDQQFCIDRDKTLDVDEPELRKIFEENIERQLFGEKRDLVLVSSCRECERRALNAAHQS